MPTLNWKGFWNTSLDTIDATSPICPTFNEGTNSENLSCANGTSCRSIGVRENKYNTNIDHNNHKLKLLFCSFTFKSTIVLYKDVVLGD